MFHDRTRYPGNLEDNVAATGGGSSLVTRIVLVLANKKDVNDEEVRTKYHAPAKKESYYWYLWRVSAVRNRVSLDSR